MAMIGLYSRLPSAFLLSGLIAGTIMLFEPLKSAVVNWGEIGIGVTELLTRLVMPFALVWVAIAVIATLLTALVPRRSIPLLVALYALLWAQGNLLVWDYGTFDGSFIDWNEHFEKGLLEAACWLAILTLAVTWPDQIQRRVRSITATVFALQLVSLGGLVYVNSPFQDKPELERSNPIDEISLYSRDTNVFVILLDGLQSDFFSEAMRNPKLRASIPSGFTYYRNAVSLYAMTEFSLPSLLTSKAVPDSVNTHQWKLKEMAGSLPTRLAERGFDGWAFSFAQHLYCDVTRYKFKCVRSATLGEDDTADALWREDVSNLFAVGLFRLVPHFLKPHIYDDGAWQIRRLYRQREAIKLDPRIEPQTVADLAIFDQIIRSASAGDVAPRFRFFHFFGSHYPSTVDEDCDYEEDPRMPLRDRAIATTHCMLSRLYAFFHKLDEIGVYDTSLIIVVSDHGHMHVPLDVSAASPGLAESTRVNHLNAQTRREAVDMHGRGVPVFLAKPIGDRGPLRTSDLPVSLCDVPKSVMDALDIENDFGCESIFARQSTRQTPRMHYRYLSISERRKLPPSERDTLVFDKYAVSGHSWLDESWVPLESMEGQVLP